MRVYHLTTRFLKLVTLSSMLWFPTAQASYAPKPEVIKNWLENDIFKVYRYASTRGTYSYSVFKVHPKTEDMLVQIQSEKASYWVVMNIKKKAGLY